MHTLSLEHLTVAPANPAELIEIAAAVNCPLVYLDLRFTAGDGSEGGYSGQPSMVAQTRRLAASLGVEIRTSGTLLMRPDLKFDAVKRMIDDVAELGAKDVLSVGYDPDAERGGENFARVCEAALERGMGVLLKPVSFRAVSTLKQGEEMLRRFGNERSGLVVDILHLYRTGGSVADIGKIEPRFLRYGQICDGPLKFDLDPVKRNEESRLQRAVPGEGEFAIAEFIRALPDGIPLGIDVPLADRAAQGMSPLDRARLCVEATRRIQESF
jgi:sugar phosphate isomerase/epimerase